MSHASRDHWERVWREAGPTGGSWFEADPVTSLELIDALGLAPSARIVDVGGGASTLVDPLLLRGYGHVTVVDLSARALSAARARLGDRAERVTWIEGDVLGLELPEPVDLWHDRAAFHFLLDPADQSTYAERLRASLAPGGYVVLATFALDGPARCSGLEVARHSATTVARVLGPRFDLLRAVDHEHVTPAGGRQRFSYTAWRASSAR